MDKAVEEPRSIQSVTRADLRAARHADERLFADSWASTDIISDRVLFLILAGREKAPSLAAVERVLDTAGGFFRGRV